MVNMRLFRYVVQYRGHYDDKWHDWCKKILFCHATDRACRLAMNWPSYAWRVVKLTTATGYPPRAMVPTIYVPLFYIAHEKSRWSEYFNDIGY